MTPTADLEIIGSRGSMPITAIIDTGFDGYVCLPTSIAVQLGLDLVSQGSVELADGTVKSELLFAGSVRFLGATRAVQVYLTDSEDALIGTSLLADCRLLIDFRAGTVRLSQKPPRRGKGKME